MLTRVFIMGPTGVGKTTYAQKVADLLGCSRISAGGWARQTFPDITDTQALTNAALGVLQHTPNRTVEWVGERPSEGFQVIDGVRNPRDLVLLSNPSDVFVLLAAPGLCTATTWEETGLDAIRAYLQFCNQTWGTRVVQSVRRGSYYSMRPEKLITFYNVK